MDQIFQENYSIRNILDEGKTKIYKFPYYDQYGGYIPVQQYLKKPKLLISKIKYHITSFLISIKFEIIFGLKII